MLKIYNLKRQMLKTASNTTVSDIPVLRDWLCCRDFIERG